MLDKNSVYQLKGRIWIEINDQTFIGEGKARLLKTTASLGSLRKAAAELNISYRKAWYSLNQMNKASHIPLIILNRGGIHGGIAEITDFGKQVVAVFDRIEQDFNLFLFQQSSMLHSLQ